MKKTVVMWGIGEMAGVFARAFLRSGHPVQPVTREMNAELISQIIPDPELVVLAVGESALETVLANIPENWQDRLVLLQNELLPKTWEAAGLSQPTVISVWFEKKPGSGPKAILSSPIYGPKADLLSSVLATIGLDSRVLSNDQELLHELVLKNAYILTSNIAGLKIGGTTGKCWQNHEDLARKIAQDVLSIQSCITKVELNQDQIIADMGRAFMADPDHQCMGRSAPERLKRALIQARELGLSVHKLETIEMESLT